MGQLFGTDGIRGIANKDLTCDMAFSLGKALVGELGKTIVVGRDTRLSGDMLEASVVAGITSAGGNALCAGVIPTPAVALLVRSLSADGGLVISASHNPPEYNGLKVFNAQGFKLSDNQEARIEAILLENNASLHDDDVLVGEALGQRFDIEDASEIYINHVVESIKNQGVDFTGLKLVLDCAHGASLYTSPEALRRLGATLEVLHDSYTGMDINVDCGSTHLDTLKQRVLETGADLGIAHDGDADRVLFVASDGSEIDGDQVLACCALDLLKRNMLPAKTVVATVMSNLGLVRALEEQGIALVQTKVGDRFVLEHMREYGHPLGGEQSGHTIFLEYNSTGDGLMTAVQFIAAALRLGGFEAALVCMKRYPQELINVRLDSIEGICESERMQKKLAEAEAVLGDTGRVLLRKSGTEPVIRVMVEAQDAKRARSICEELAEEVRRSAQEM